MFAPHFLATTAPAAPFPYAGEVAATFTALLWAGAMTAFGSVRTQISGSALNLAKNATASLCFLVFLLVRDGRPVPLDMPVDAFWLLAAAGFLGLTLCDVFLMRALLSIGPQRTSLLFCLAPVLTIALAAFPPFNEHPGWTALGGVALTLGGIVMAILERPASGAVRGDLRQGLRDAAIASLFQAATILLVREATLRHEVDGASGAAVRLYVGTAGLVLLGLVRGSLRRWWTQMTRPRTRFVVPIAAFFGTFLGIWGNQLGLQWSRHAGVAATLNALTPVFLLPLSAWFLGERRGAIAWIATAIAVAGAALMALGQK